MSSVTVCFVSVELSSLVDVDVSCPGQVDRGHEDTKGLIEVSREVPDTCSTPQQR